MCNKPPLGLRPQSLYESEVSVLRRGRIQEILVAMSHYTAANKSIPDDWLAELFNLAGEA